MKILVVEDHPLTRYGLESVLSSLIAGAEVVGAGSVAEALAALNRPPRPDVILLDLRLPTLADGIGLLRQLRVIASTAPVLVVSGEDAPDLVAMARDAGAFGFVSKSDGADKLLAAISSVAGTATQPRAARPAFFRSDALMRAAQQDGTAAPCPDLIPRAWQVYVQVAQGKPNKLIARDMDITVGSVKNYVTRILDATGAANRAEAIVLFSDHIERWRLDQAYRGQR
ncbi:MAG: response regulator transcription factor [Burkholderiaceae bacterium]|jgi:DNA-binding NarL/FixJ family response regulator|nr:response regulator transcription factor [Burkholderiaceae bacterium]